MTDAKPEFLIAGAMRSGTTALYRALRARPGVFMPGLKEPAYFAVDVGLMEYRGPGDEWFARQATKTWDTYQALFGGCAPGEMAGEASAIYLAIPECAELIAKRLPDVRLIFVLRDPLARALSAYRYLRSRGRENVLTFTEGLELEDRRRAQGYGPMWWYRGAGEYQAGIQAFLNVFPREQLLFICQEDLMREPVLSVRRVLGHLGKELDPAFEGVPGGQVNSGGQPRWEWLVSALYPPDSIRWALRSVAPRWAVGTVRRLRAFALKDWGDEGCCEERELMVWRAEQIREVERLTGQEFDAWEK